MLSEKVRNRLYNWKFAQAANQLEIEDEADIQQGDDGECELVCALALVLGDCGWFEGNLGIIVTAAVSPLLGDST